MLRKKTGKLSCTRSLGCRNGRQRDSRRVRCRSSGSDADIECGERGSEHADSAGHSDRQIYETAAGWRATGHGSYLHTEGKLEIIIKQLKSF